MLDIIEVDATFHDNVLPKFIVKRQCALHRKYPVYIYVNIREIMKQ